MAPELAAALVAVVALSVGLGVLRALGLATTPRAMLPAAGLAYVTGIVAIGLPTLVLLAAGVAVDLVTVALVALAVGAVAWGVGLRRKRPLGDGNGADARPWTRLDRAAVVVFLVALAAMAVVGGMAASVTPLSHWDAWSIWGRKAVVLTQWSQLPVPFFKHASSGMQSPDYPLLLPLLESVHLRLIGATGLRSAQLELWLLAIGSAGAMAFLGARLTRPLVWAPVVLCTVVAPGLYRNLVAGYADAAMAAFLGPGILLLGIWLRNPRPRTLALATLLLAGAASAKDEGLFGAVAALAVAVAIHLARRRRHELAQLGLAALGLALLLAPWRLWVAAHGIPGQIPVGRGLSSGFLSSRSDRIGPTVGRLTHELGNRHNFLLLVALALALCGLGFLFSRVRAVATFYLAVGVLFFGAVVWAICISRVALVWQLHTASDRVVQGIVAVSAAAILQLSGLLPDAGPSPAENGVLGRTRLRPRRRRVEQRA